MAKQSDHIVALTDIASGNEIGKNEPISVKCEEDPLESAEATKKSKGCRHERIETVGSDITEGSSKVDQARKESKPSCSENSFVCKVCGKTFRRLSKLKAHKVSHRDDRPFQCVKCGKSFKCSTKLTRHVGTVHSNKRPFKCDECGKGFKTMEDMKSHGLVHKKERPWKCTDCEKSFKKAEILKTHEKTHTVRERLHKCNQCEKSYTTASSLKYHMVTHNEEKSFTCRFCGKTSTSFVI